MPNMNVIKWDGEKISRPCLVSGLPIDRYHAADICDGPSISSSGLRTIFSKSPAHFWAESALNDEEDEEDEEETEDGEGEDDEEGEGGDDPPPARAPARRRRRRPRVNVPEPHPPSMRFEVDGRVFFVVNGLDEPRAGVFGHYLKPFTIDDNEECVPFPPPPGFESQPVAEGDRRGIAAGWPGFPWPSPPVVEYVQRKWQKDREQWISRQDVRNMRDIAGWDCDFLDYYRDYAKLSSRNKAVGPIAVCRDMYNTPAQAFVLRHNGPPGLKDPSLPPNIDACKEDIHFIACSSPLDNACPKYYEVGSEYLRLSVERGEALDFAFARRIQGLMGVGQEAVWACLDPDFNPADRPGMLDRFTGSYTAGFYKGVAWEDQQDPRAVATEALQQHKAFCQVSVRSVRLVKTSSDSRRTRNESSRHAFRDGPALLYNSFKISGPTGSPGRSRSKVQRCATLRFRAPINATWLTGPSVQLEHTSGTRISKWEKHVNPWVKHWCHESHSGKDVTCVGGRPPNAT